MDISAKGGEPFQEDEEAKIVNLSSLVGVTATPPVDSPASLRIPKSIAEVDNGKILGFGADLAEDHPVGICFLLSVQNLVPFVGARS